MFRQRILETVIMGNSNGQCRYKKIFLLACIFIALYAIVPYVYVPTKIQYRTMPHKARNASSKTVVLTATNWLYYYAIRNFIGSVQYWEPRRPIVVYNIGMFKWQLYELSKMCNVYVHWPDGIPAEYPEHVRHPFVYAWKPLAIKDAVDKYKKVIWIDAGSDIRGHLNLVDKDLERDGFFFIPGGTIAEYLHMGMYNYMKLNKPEILKEGGFAGCVQGYVKNSFAYHHVLKPLYECCLHKDCISPPGSSLKNHRYDQSALSLLVRASGINMTSRMHNGYENFLREYYEKDHTVPSKTIIYTARLRSQEYVKHIRRFQTPLDCLDIL